jgi:2-succinyl-5-enolpyruvyl-6-hydroxy-3-cyclohexene-1-carboxylate synthase
MPCRDFSTFGSLKKEGSSWPYRLVSANRGANGIDGVISTACGFSASISGTTFLLIGDVAALHDLSGLAVALNVHPGSSARCIDLKIICVNNSGGAIFSFLKIKSQQDVFHPYFDTPHNMSISEIANAMKPGCAVKVENVETLKLALENPSIDLIECVALPSHDANVELHNKIRRDVADTILSYNS